MPTRAATYAKSFGRNEEGAVAVIFGLVVTALVMFVGMALDVGRAVHTNSQLSSAMDAAALAAAKGMRLEGLTDAQATTLAVTVFNENMNHSSGRWAVINSIDVQLNRGNSSALVTVDASVPMAFAGVMGYRTVDLPKSAVAIFDIKDIEVGLQLDLTGSMCNPCTKISALRTATANLLDILLPDGGTPNQVRVALAPFAQSVNAGALAGPATNYRSTDGCVYESSASNPNTDATPGNGAWLKVAGDAGVTGTRGLCPAGPKVIPLTSDKTALKREVASYGTYNATAGHLGTAWAWYLISPNWANLMPSTSRPVAYNDGRTIKTAILMTDGVYNTIGGVDLGDLSSTATDSQARASAMCDNMKAQGIVIYTVGFDLSAISTSTARNNATNMLRACASSPDKFFQAESGAELTTAFTSIATHIASLRLSQ